MPEQQTQLADRSLVSRLLDLSTELLMKGDAENAFTCTQAAARILAIPASAERMTHASAKVPEGVNPIAAVVDSIINRDGTR